MNFKDNAKNGSYISLKKSMYIPKLMEDAELSKSLTNWSWSNEKNVLSNSYVITTLVILSIIFPQNKFNKNFKWKFQIIKEVSVGREFVIVIRTE